LGSEEQAKQQLVSQARKVAVDHFAGKQEQLKQAMDQMSKYKQKYESVQSIEELPKRPPHAMRGKPFYERLVPGRDSLIASSGSTITYARTIAWSSFGLGYFLNLAMEPFIGVRCIDQFAYRRIIFKLGTQLVPLPSNQIDN